MLTILAVVLYCFDLVQGAPVGTEFTYQGRLMDANGPPDGLHDFQFSLFDSPESSAYQVGPTIEVNDVDVIDGYFTVELDFGSKAFDGDARWLQIVVMPRQRGTYVHPNSSTGDNTGTLRDICHKHRWGW